MPSKDLVSATLAAFTEKANTGLQATLLRYRSETRLNPTVRMPVVQRGEA